MRIPRFEAQTEWVKPTEFPDLRQADEVAIDLEKAKHYIDMIIERDYGPQENWINGYNKWKELSEKGVVSNKVKLGDLKKLLKKERCPHN